MFNRLTVKTLLQSTLLVLAVLAVVPLTMRAWDAWQAVRSSSRILGAADASGDAFRVMVNIRSDRNSVPRSWASPNPIGGEVRSYIKQMQDDEMSALRSAVIRLESVEFNERARLLPTLRQSLDVLTRLQTEFWDGVSKPAASRRAGLGEEYLREGVSLQTTLEGISAQLFAGIQHQDAIVDQMMAIKQLAWLARNTAGEASLLISRGISAGSLPADAVRRFDTNLGGSNAAWSAIENLLYGGVVPPALSQAVATAKQVYFAPDYMALREKTLTTLIAGNKPSMTADEWAMTVVPKLGAMQGVASAALTAAKDRAETMITAAEEALIFDTIFALLVAAGSIAGLLAVSRRVIRPLHAIRDAMSLLATGRLTETLSFRFHDDEIGALASTLHVFQEQAVVKAQLEEAGHTGRTRDSARQRTVEAEIKTFEDNAGVALATLTDAATRMRGASDEMEAVSGRTIQGVQAVADAATETSGSVTSIAAATEQLSGSINEINRHVGHAAGITSRAVEETRRTDTTVRGLAESASKIGEVVRLINDIAGRTNLLALNATIEAARAGDAGKGFAVVASEVKSLATQTAKATEEIARQITEVQSVTDETVQAIRRIATTIGEVNEITTSIAAGVAQQGASTQEIARNVQQAAQRTREMSETIASVSRDADVTGATVRDVKSAASAVDGGTDTLRHRVDAFLEGIRAA
jgi:methyl-accepting chemotaxis protein